jgi:hypothetical protein
MAVEKLKRQIKEIRPTRILKTDKAAHTKHVVYDENG